MRKILQVSALALVVSIPYSCSREDEAWNSTENIKTEKFLNRTNAENSTIVQKASLGPNEDPRQDGAFILDHVSGKIYVKFEGKLRHITTMATFEGLFKKNEIYLFRFMPDYILYNTGATMGEPIGGNSELIRHVSTGRIYLVIGTTIRYIPDMITANRYRFNLNYVRNVSSISNFTEDLPITITY